MVESQLEGGFAPFAGAVSWPRGREDLTATHRCPACFASLTSALCARCGLDLATPLAARLLAASMSAADALDERVSLIGRIRYEADAAARVPQPIESENRVARAGSAGADQNPAAPPVDAAVGFATAPVSSSSTTAPIGPTAPTSAPRPAEPASMPPSEQPARRGSSVQVILLIIGVSLLSVGAIFFLVYAFINYGILARSIIIGGLTVAAFTVATLLARRRLRATAEGIAAFAVLLVYLDAYAVRANDFFGAASSDGLLYWGATVLLAGVGLVAWHRASRLRAPGFAGFVSLPLGVGLITGSVSQPLADSERTYLVFAAMALAALVHRLVPARSTPSGTNRFDGLAERSLLLGTAAFAIAVAAISTATFADDPIAARVLALVGIASVAALHVGVLLGDPPRGVRVWNGLLSTAIGVALAVTGFVAVLPLPGLDPLVVWPAIVATIVTLGLELLGFRLLALGSLGRRFGPARAAPILRSASVVGFRSAAVVTAVALSVPLLSAGERLTWYFVYAFTSPLDFAADDTIFPSGPQNPLPVITLAICIALAAVFWSAGGRLRRRAVLIAWATAAVLTLAVPLLDVLWVAVSVWFTLGVAALAVLLTMGRSALVQAIRRPLIGLVAGATSSAWLAAWGGVWTWLPAALVAVTIVLAARGVAHPGPRGAPWRASLAGVATTLVLLASGAVPTLLLPGDAVADGVRFVLAASAVLVIACSVDPGEFAATGERRVVFWISLGAAAVMTVAASLSGDAELLPDPSGALALAGGLLVALLAVIASPGTRRLPIERIAASIAVTPTLALLLDAFARVIGAPQLVTSVAPITAALLAAAGSLAVTLLRPSSVPRALREIGVGLVAVPAVASAALLPTPSTWLALLLAGVAALLVALERDGLFSSSSRRKNLGWVALALLVAGLWWRLGDDEVQRVEPYVLPVAGLLLVVALLIWRGNRQRMTRLPPPGIAAPGPSTFPGAPPAAVIALAGLLVAVLPIASAAAADGGNPVVGAIPFRALSIGGASAVLLLIGAFLPSRAAGLRPFLDAAALAGAVGVIVTSVGRAVFIAIDRPRLVEIDAWLAAGFVLLVASAFGLARVGDDAFTRQRELAGVTLAVVALVAITSVECWVIARTDGSLLRPLIVVLLLCTVHLIAFLVDRAPLTRSIAWLAIGCAAITGTVAVASEALDPLELASLPIAIALLATGVTHLEANRVARSWPWLAPGVTVLLVPSLIATIDDRPLWRLVAIGVVAVGVLVVAVVRRLQAPFTIAAVVVVIHAASTFAPQVRAVYESVEWWLWLVIGGVILIALAGRYEQRLANLKSAVGRYSALR